MKKPYSEVLCPLHKEHGEIAAICQRCYSLALTQQRKQLEAVRKREHAKYLSRQLKKAA